MGFKKQLVLSGIAALTLLLALTIAVLTVLPNGLGWFSFNQQTNTGGMGANSFEMPMKETFSAKLNGVDVPISEGQFLFNNIEPGDVLEFAVIIENANEFPAGMSVSFFAPTEAEEVPVTDAGGQQYYFSSQLQITGITANGVDVGGTGGYLFSPVAGAYDPMAPQVTAPIPTESGRTPGKVSLATNVEIPAKNGAANGTLIFRVNLTFINTDYVQNIFRSIKTFGRSMEILYAPVG